jgi:hypothetical protein
VAGIVTLQVAAFVRQSDRAVAGIFFCGTIFDFGLVAVE